MQTSHRHVSVLIPEILLLIEQIGPGTSKIYDLRTPIAVLFQTGTFETVKGVRDAFSAADDAFVLVVAERTLITDAHQCRRSNVAIAHRTLAVAFIAQSS